MENDLSVKLEILRMAKEIVNNEYIDKRAQDHNKWLADSEKHASRGIKIPYPDIPPYPDESVVIAKAKSLLGFIGIDDVENIDPLEKEVPVEVKEEPDLPKVEEVIEVTKEEQPLVPAPVEQKTEPKSEEELFQEYVNKRISYQVEEEIPSSSKIISMLLKQIGDLKRLRK